MKNENKKKIQAKRKKRFLFWLIFISLSVMIIGGWYYINKDLSIIKDFLPDFLTGQKGNVEIQTPITFSTSLTPSPRPLVDYIVQNQSGNETFYDVNISRNSTDNTNSICIILNQTKIQKYISDNNLTNFIYNASNTFPILVKDEFNNIINQTTIPLKLIEGKVGFCYIANPKTDFFIKMGFESVTITKVPSASTQIVVSGYTTENTYTIGTATELTASCYSAVNTSGGDTCLEDEGTAARDPYFWWNVSLPTGVTINSIFLTSISAPTTTADIMNISIYNYNTALWESKNSTANPGIGVNATLTFNLISTTGYVNGSILRFFSATTGVNLNDMYQDYMSANITLTETTNPNVTNLVPLAQTNFTKGQIIEISTNVTDNIAVQTVLANITLPNGTANQVTLSITNGGPKYNNSYTIPYLTGQYNFTILANDTSNNLNNSEKSNFYARASQLTIVNFTSPLNNSVVAQNDTFIINVTVQCLGEAGGNCGIVNAYARYNKSISTPDNFINETFNSIPLYIQNPAQGEGTPPFIYDRTFFSVGGQGSFFRGITFNGTYFWASDDTNNKVYRYNLTNTGTYDGTSFSVATEDTSPTGITFNETYFWVVGNLNDRVYRYNLTNNGTYDGTSFSVAIEDTSPSDIYFNGTYFWVVGDIHDIVYRYNLTNNGTYDGTSFSVGEDTAPSGITFNGTYFWVVGDTGNKIRRYNLTNTGTYDGWNFTVSVNPSAITKENNYFWIIDSFTNNVSRYSQNYTSGLNLQTSGTNLLYGQNYTFQWTINATGTNLSQYKIDVYINSSFGNLSVQENDTIDRTICIGACTPPVVTTCPDGSITNNASTHCATNFTNNATVGTIAWTNPDNAKESDNIYATALLALGQQTNYLRASNFTFNIPNGNIIQGIRIDIERKADILSAISDTSVKLMKADGTLSSDRSNSSTWGTSDQMSIYGSNQSDLWGLTLNNSDVNAQNFSFVISVTGGLAGTASIDAINMTVYYYSSNTCTYTSGNWNLLCSDNCSYNSNTNVAGNVSISGAGNITFLNGGKWNWTTSNNYVFINKSLGNGCYIYTYPGGGWNI